MKEIMQQMAEITEQSKQLTKMVEEPTITPNKIWLPNKGIVTLWEVKH